jgi:hypothetical protein
VALLVEDLDGTASAGSMSLGWFSPAVIEEIELHDSNGQTLLTATKITGDRSLWALLTDRSDLGTIRVEGAELHLSLRPDGSNLEDVLRPLLESEDPSTGPIHARIEMIDATLVIEDASDGGRWKVDRLNAQIDLTDGGGQEIHVTASGVIPNSQATGRFALGVQVTLAAGDAPSAAAGGTVKLKTEAIPMEMLQPLLLRFAPPTDLAGRINCDAEVQWSLASSPSVQIKGRVDVDDFQLSAAWLGDDVIRLRGLEVPCDIAYREGRLHLRQLSVACDVGRLTVSGSTQLDPLDAAGLSRALLSEIYQLDGQIDLAALARILPKTLRIKDGTTITGGHVRFGLSRGGDGDHVRYRANLTAEKLAADGPDGPILWKQPIEVTLSVQESAEQTVIDQLHYRSDFLTFQASGPLDDLTANAAFDLQRLLDQIAQLVDVGDFQLAGRGRGQFHIRRSDEAQFTAAGRIEVDQFRLNGAGQRSWTEDRVTIALDVAGRIVDGRPTQLQSGTVTASVGDERLIARLVSPVSNILIQNVWPVRLQITTRRAPWLPRLEPWLPLRSATATGDCRFDALVDCSSGGVLVRESHLEIDRLNVTTEGLRIVEPHVDVKLAGQWDIASGNIVASLAEIKSAALSATIKNFSGGFDEAGQLQLAGAIHFQGDAARLQSCFSDGKATPQPYKLTGRLSGTLQIAGSAGPTLVELQIVGEDLALAHRPRPAASAAPLVVRPTSRIPGAAPAVPTINRLREPLRAAGQVVQILWRESNAALKISSRYDASSDVVEITSVSLSGHALHLQAAGKVTSLTSRPHLELGGHVDYDLAKFSPLLRRYVGGGMEISGRDKGTFSFSGPLTTPDAPLRADRPARSWIESLSADAQLGWQQLDVYGLRVEKGTLRAKLVDGQLSIAPLDLKVNQGRITAAPSVRLTGKHAVLALGKGPLARDIVLNKEVCAGALKFIAPVLADAVEAQGRFSIDLDGASVPLHSPRNSSLSGRLTVHSIQLKSGPLTSQFLRLASQLETLFRGGGLAGRVSDSKVTMPENQQVAFRMADGRIHHQGLEWMAAGVVLRTSGSVGTDETLDLIVDLPIQEKWIGRNSRLAPWRNQVVRIPIRGTLSRPKVDTRVLGDLAAKLAQQAGQKFLENQFNKGLEKLFRPSPAKR